jgi:hypothetical protein
MSSFATTFDMPSDRFDTRPATDDGRIAEDICQIAWWYLEKFDEFTILIISQGRMHLDLR